MTKNEEMSVEAAADMLGMSRRMLEQRIEQGDIPHVKVGSERRLTKSDVAAFQAGENGRRSALAEFGEQTDDLVAKHGH